MGEEPEVSFSRYRDYYLKDSSVKAVVDNLTAQVVGSGFYITSALPEAKEVIDRFNEEAAIDEWLQQVCREVLYAGNSFTEYPDDWLDPPEFTGLMIELSSIVKIRRTETGEVKEIVQRIGGKEISIDPRRVIHFAWNVVDRRAFGTSLLSPLATLRRDCEGELVPALLDIKAQIENDMRKVIHKYPPRFLIHFDVSDERFERDIKPLLEGARPGEDFATNVKVDFKELSVSSRARFDSMLEWLLNQTYLALETPLPRLLTTTGFTEASAKAAIEIAESFREMLRRFLKRRYERLVVRPCLQAHGIDPMKANVRLHWGTVQVPELRFDDLSKAFELGGLRYEEFRKNLQKFGVELWEPASDEERSEHKALLHYASERLRRLG